jgi:HAD superfamily hydrolase (TIGR01509 family)
MSDNLQKSCRAVPRGILFDFDGTLIDSEPIAARCLVAFASEVGLRLDPDILELLTGSSYTDLFKEICRRNPQVGEHGTVRERFLAMLGEVLIQEAKLLPGLPSWVAKAAERAPLGVVSGSPKMHIEHLLRKLSVREYFSIIVAAEDVLLGKPAPDGYLHACHALGLSPPECVAFEDSQLGVAAARAAGLTVIGVEAGNRGTQNLEKAHLVIRSFADAEIKDIFGISAQKRLRVNETAVDSQASTENR